MGLGGVHDGLIKGPYNRALMGSLWDHLLVITLFNNGSATRPITGNHHVSHFGNKYIY